MLCDSGPRRRWCGFEVRSRGDVLEPIATLTADSLLQLSTAFCRTTLTSRIQLPPTVPRMAKTVPLLSYATSALESSTKVLSPLGRWWIHKLYIHPRSSSAGNKEPWGRAVELWLVCALDLRTSKTVVNSQNILCL